MNAVFCSLSVRRLLLLLLGVCALLLCASPALATEPALNLSANFMMDLVGDRSRLLQVSLVCVVFGCALLWWKR